MIKETTRHFDVLGDVLETLRFRGSIFFRSDLAAPWGMALQATHHPRFHIALRGGCVVGVENDDPVGLEEMNIVILPQGNGHWIADRPHRTLVPSERAGAACELGDPLFQQGEITHRLICGMIDHDPALHHPLLDALPPVMRFQDIGQDDPIWMTVLLIDAELRNGAGLRSAIADRLSEVLFLQLLGEHITRQAEATGFFAALGDQRMNRLLSLIHRHPERGWTLDSLGAQAGMSRATITRRFKQSLGMPPLTYIANWRLLKAHHLLKQTALPLEWVAERTGFSSARTLNKAFQRRYGYTPSALRKQQRRA